MNWTAIHTDILFKNKKSYTSHAISTIYEIREIGLHKSSMKLIQTGTNYNYFFLQARWSSDFRNFTFTVQRKRVLGHIVKYFFFDSHILQAASKLYGKPQVSGRRHVHRAKNQGQYFEKRARWGDNKIE